eukprot:XP_011452793.1 PREDICTED: lectin BRA-3-like [Crassostrea gigas]
MRVLEFCIFCALFALVFYSMGSDAAPNEDDVLMKNISNLHFQLFSSIQKKTKMIKTAVFETQCSGTGCTFNGCESSGSETCDGQMFTKLNTIQSSINSIWKKKPTFAATSIVCKKGWKRYDGHCYYLFIGKMNWFEAQFFCRKQGTTMLQINNANENKWVANSFPNVPYWIDSTDIGREGKWVTLSTGKSGYTNWHSRPDNAGGNQHCAFNNFGRHLGRWDDVGCKYPLQVICEASGSGF